MLAIEKIRNITPENLPVLTILTGDDLGQFELLKDEFLKQIHYDPADLNVTLFDMKETAIFSFLIFTKIGRLLPS